MSNSPWVGGDNFNLVRRGSNNRQGGVHSGSGSSQNPALRKNGRFNSNPTLSNHPMDMIRLQAKRDKEHYEKVGRHNRPVIRIGRWK